MSKLGFFIRFTVIYTLAMAAAGVVISLLGVGMASGVNAPILMGAAYWCFYSFSTKNTRLVRDDEKWHLIFLALAGDILTSMVLGTPTALANDIPVTYLLIGVVIIAPLHFLLLMFINFMVKKALVKQRSDLVES
ncbi:ABZJ_00895 family protein [Marinimicrobium agarilyticum]|uniref:ABZJ_00895 family protein n=1 Tax=Marinimicrobium agarilyticum TaxID=306546 RepID=UPI00047FDD58|nr:ABZJ_00895 family protein [Marinimicrobium agarilyticum]